MKHSATRSGAALRLDGKLTRDIVERILSVATPDRVIVFGSAATGRLTPDGKVIFEAA